MSFESHVAAVGFAGRAVDELQAMLIEAERKHGEVLAMVVTATGSNPVTPPARDALRTTQTLVNDIYNAAQKCDRAKQSLNEYGQAWMGPGR